MNYSKFHKSFANNLNYYNNINKQDVLDYPEHYLGPNYKEVLNWWFYWGSLSEEQREVYLARYFNLDRKTRIKAHDLSKKLASEVIDPRFIDDLYYEELREIVAAHLYIERNIPFTFLPLIFDL
jgi:hypothetical protein